MAGPNDRVHFVSRANFGNSLALSEASGPVNARLIAAAYQRARDYGEDAHTALLAVIRTDWGIELWNQAREERLRASEAMPS